MLPPPSTLLLPPDTEAVTRTLQWLTDLAQCENWPQHTAFALKLSADEAVTNVVSYAFDAKPNSAALRLSYWREGPRFFLEIADNGAAYDPTAAPPSALSPTLEDTPIGGHGLRLIRHYLENMQYARQDGWNCLTLVAHLDAPTKQTPPGIEQ